MPCLRAYLAVLLIVIAAPLAHAEDRSLRLAAPEALQDNGFLKYLLPRFSLKHGLRVTLDTQAPDLRLEAGGGAPLFADAATTYGLTTINATPAVEKLVAWLRSDVGQRTIFAYAPDGDPLFQPAAVTTVETAPVEMDGNASAGRDVSLSKCGRCHVVAEENRMGGIGSTPSFAVLRSLPDWQDRFEIFYVLNPHPSFTQVAEVTPAFDEERPPPVVPVSMTIEDLEDILAYVAGMTAADLGAPLQHQ